MIAPAGSGARRLDGERHALGSFSRVLVLPHSHDRPASPLERLIVPLITGHIQGDLLVPVPGVRDRSPAVVWASMPEAAIHKDRDTLSREDQIGSAAERRDWPAVLAEPKPAPVDGGAHRNLCPRVLCAIALHHPSHRLGARGRWRVEHDAIVAAQPACGCPRQLGPRARSTSPTEPCPVRDNDYLGDGSTPQSPSPVRSDWLNIDDLGVDHLMLVDVLDRLHIAA